MTLRNSVELMILVFFQNCGLARFARPAFADEPT